MTIRILAGTALAATILLATGAHAQSYAQTEKPMFTLGAGVVVAPEYSGSDSYDTYALPLISFEREISPGNTVYLKGLNAGLDHALDERLSVGLMASYRFDRESDDSTSLAGMRDVDAAIEIGPKVRLQATPQLGFEATMLVDTANSHNGFTGRAGADYAMPLSEVTMLTFSGGVNYGSEDFVETYYGVTAAEARVGRPAYSPDAGFTHLDAGVGVRHSFTPNWSVQGRLAADYLLGDTADSPLVKDEFQPKLMLGLAYSF